MRSKNLLPIFLISSLVLSQCGGKVDPGQLHREADSLLKHVIELQNKLGSAEIQRINEFENELNEDIALLAGQGEEDTSLVKYLDLYNGLGQCMEICHQFHEEAFLLESSVRDILVEIGQEDAETENIREAISFEQSIYLDLASRVDSSLDLILEQVELFYRLKPEIEALKDSMQNVPGPE
jgi:hypothetical protein